MEINVLTLVTCPAQYSAQVAPFLPSAMVIHCATETIFKANLGKNVSNLIVVIEDSFVNKRLLSVLNAGISYIIILSKCMDKPLLLLQKHISEYMLHPFESIPITLTPQKSAFLTKIHLPSATSVDIIDISKIIYIAGENNSSLFVTTEGNFKVYQTLKTYEIFLKGHDFQRVSKGELVNLHHVKRYLKEDATLYLMGKTKVTLSKHYKNEFWKAMEKITIIVS